MGALSALGQAGLGSLHRVGDAAQPRLSRPGRLRQDEVADDRHGKPTRTTRARGERRGRRQVRVDEPVENWIFIPVPPLITDETFALAQERLARNAQFAKRNTRAPGPLQGLVVCRECGYSCYRTSVRTTKRKIVYYRCIGQDNWRHVGGRVCNSRPIRAAELEPLVWGEVRRLVEDPTLVRGEIDRRLAALRTEHPAARRREALERDLTRATAAVERLIEAYQEQLLSLDELRARMPTLRKRQSTLQAPARQPRRRAARRRDLPQARRHARGLPRSPRRRTGSPQCH